MSSFILGLTPMGLATLGMATLGLALALCSTWLSLRRARRAEHIRRYVFPPGLFDKLRRHRPDLSTKDCQLAAHALRQFFLAHLRSGCRFVSMPSQVADELWHEFILYTRHYQLFCRQAFGRYMHHSPAVVLGSVRESNTGLRRCWWHACLEENIDPRRATRLPLLFALDAKLGIGDGFHYALDCNGLQRNSDGGSTVVYCGSDMSSSSFDGGTDGFGDSAGDGGDGGGGGCGGGD